MAVESLVLVIVLAVIAGGVVLFLASRKKGLREGDRGSAPTSAPRRPPLPSDAAGAPATSAGKASAATSPAPVATSIATPPSSAPASPAARIFMSYRRDDNPYVAGRIYDGLVERFGPDGVFKDVDSLRIGVDFRDAIDDAIATATIALVVMGSRWLGRDARDKRRIDDARDFVRIEVAAALRRGIPVVPLLVDGAAMPEEADLPEDVRSVAYRQALAIRPDPDFRNDFDRLVRGIRDAHGPADGKGHAQPRSSSEIIKSAG